MRAVTSSTAAAILGIERKTFDNLVARLDDPELPRGRQGVERPAQHGHAVDINHRLAANLGVADQGVCLAAIAREDNGCHLVLYWIEGHKSRL